MQQQQQQIPGLEVLTKLSSGGMGDILLARRRSTYGFEKLFAVKVIKGGLAQRSTIRAMFLDEARLVAQLNHPTIAQVYDFGEVDETLYLSMEYIPGLPLNQLIQRGAIPPLVAARIAVEVARGLHAAHELTDLDGQFLEVVHRDVSPGNLILNFDGRIKILDFGIAFMKQRESPDTAHGERKGKPSYMAPEQLLGKRADRRSDVYSLSVVLHEMLTGRKLFKQSTAAATAIAIIDREHIYRPSMVNEELPKGLDDIVMKGLAKDPADRFETARQMADQLEALITRERGASVETYAEEVLATERQAHRSWLQSLLQTRVPRESSMVTSSSPYLLRPYFESIHSPVGPARSVREPVTRKERLSSLVASARRAVIPEISTPNSTTIADFPRAHRQKPKTPDHKPEISDVPILPTSSTNWSSTVEGETATLPPPSGSHEPITKDQSSPDRYDSDYDRYGPSLRGVAVAKKISFPSPASVATIALYMKTGLAVVPVMVLIWFIMTGRSEISPSPTDKSYTSITHHNLNEHHSYGKMTPVYRNKNQTYKGEVSTPGLTSTASTGWLSIGAVTRVLVRVDGQAIGRTPIVRYPLPEGEHIVELIAPTSGRVIHREKVTVQKDKDARIIPPRL